MPILTASHALGGISTAGVGLCTGNIALKAAPKGEATACGATNALISGMVAPSLGGLAADLFAGQKLDFVFIIVFLLGFYASHRLAIVKEQGDVEEDTVLTHFYAEVRRHVRHVSNIDGVRNLTYFPFAAIRVLGIKTNGANGKPDEAE